MKISPSTGLARPALHRGRVCTFQLIPFPGAP
jgi:hypothetical protein